uniref:lysozyme C-like n=1 Tax=Monopterus albus TaxID=43700 RepID=UPI0009B2E837|nr:lysozyme C-like [Monopterus albus]
MSAMFSEPEVTAGDRMKTLVVFLLVVLGCGLAQGRIVDKCGLRKQLMTAFSNMTEMLGGRSKDNLVAQLVCHAEQSSGFNTSAVNQLVPKMEGHHHEDDESSERPHHRGQQHHRPQRHTQPPLGQVWTLYGLFQLGNRLVCNDSMIQDPSICEIPCNDLLDDDISAAIACLMTVLKKPHKHDSKPPGCDELRKTMMRLIFQGECRDKLASVYFKECS